MSVAPHLPAPPSLVGPRLAAMMFLEFFIWGAWYVTVGNFMNARGMADGIYWAYTVGPAAAIVSPFFLGMIADRFFATERVLAAMHLLGGAALLAAPAVARGSAGQGGAFWPFIGVLLLHMLCYMPTLGLTNTLAFHHVTDGRRQFPLIRVFGTIGWIAANVVVSKAFHADAGEAQFYIAGGAGVALGLFSLTLPHTPPVAAGRSVSARDVLGFGALRLLRDPSFAVFIVCSFLLCIPLAAYYAYAPVFVKDAGFADPAYTMSFGQMSEIAFMLVMPLCFARLGAKWMLLAGMLAWVARYGLFAAGADDHVQWMILGGVLLHGVCYDFFFVTGQIYVDRRATVEVRGQAQGFLVLVTQGLGMLIGALIAGRLFRAFTSIDPGAGAEVGGSGDGAVEAAVTDWQMVWLVPCALAALVMVAFALLFRPSNPGEPAVGHDADFRERTA